MSLAANKNIRYHFRLIILSMKTRKAAGEMAAFFILVSAISSKPFHQRKRLLHPLDIAPRRENLHRKNINSGTRRRSVV